MNDVFREKYRGGIKMLYKLLIEATQDNLELLVEGEGKERSHKIKGVFMQAEQKNRNGRIYPRHLMESQVNEYVNTKVKSKQAMGELEHPQSPHINLDRVSHLIEDLRMVGNDVYGVAKLIPTATGRQAIVLMENGIQLGVSSRGLGALGSNGMVESYKLAAIDLVSNPSAYGAMVDLIIESKEYIIENDHFVEVAYDKMKRSLDKHGSKVALSALQDFLRSIK